MSTRAEGAPPRVRVLLDVDGVLNAVTHNLDLNVWTDWRKADCMGFKIRYSPSCGARLLAVAQTPGVEVRWLTTWEHYANEWIGPLFNWPEFPVIERHDIVERASGLAVATSGWWKLDEAKALYEVDGTPFVWIDDDLDFMDDGASEWIAGLDGAAIGIRPDGEKGLTPHLLTEIEEFIARYTSETTGSCANPDTDSRPLGADETPSH